MKQAVSLMRGALEAIVNFGIALLHHKMENHLRWSLIPDESPEATQWHGSDPYLASVLNPQSNE